MTRRACVHVMHFWINVISQLFDYIDEKLLRRHSSYLAAQRKSKRAIINLPIFHEYNGFRWREKKCGKITILFSNNDEDNQKYTIFLLAHRKCEKFSLHILLLYTIHMTNDQSDINRVIFIIIGLPAICLAKRRMKPKIRNTCNFIF